jgi:hypothetical protein
MFADNFEDCAAVFYLTMKPAFAKALRESFFLQKHQSCLLGYSAVKNNSNLKNAISMNS